MSTFLNQLIYGLADGSILALAALGFVLIYKATGVINFAQGGFVLVGAYLAYNFRQTWDLPFFVALVLAMVGGALGNVLLPGLVKRYFPDRTGLMVGAYGTALSAGAAVVSVSTQPIADAVGTLQPRQQDDGQAATARPDRCGARP